ncbi:MAG TPA: methylmalonyl Co-A mutase-associated GTPase MeaB [Planctomycetota bacterium]
MTHDAEDMAARLAAGERPALARLISWAENADPRFAAALASVYPRVGKAWRVGVTGPPGAGKSSLVNALVGTLRARAETVGVLAIDPTSPFSGGALLGDRIRMEERTTDTGVYIRSMATRASHGGLARAAVDALDVMDAFGFDWLLAETVGVGQTEYEVAGAADTVLVVLCPGAGDGIQAMKAGLLEVADVLVVNKSDLPGADQLVSDLEDALQLRTLSRTRAPKRLPPVVPVSAHEGRGLPELVAAIESHRRELQAGDLAALRAEKRLRQVRRVVGERLEEALWGPGGETERAAELLGRARTPYDVADELLGAILARSAGAPRPAE